ncbi:ankyrin repeat domain-containing protein [Marinobacter algicola]|uniref:ankyrin repeat domain-containing protein n=1 Tax=Marinobacter algicola TaxID=236100 RepID=UPI003BA8E18D
MKQLLLTFSLAVVFAWSPCVHAMPPYLMAEKGQLEDLKLWVKLQGDSLDTGHKGWGGFAQSAAKRAQLPILKYLHNIGVEFETYGSLGNTPLHSAAASNQTEVVRWLLDKGFDANSQKSVNHATALHKAARYGAQESTAILLKAGADPLINSLQGTAFELAESFEVLYELMTHWAVQGDGMPPPGVSPASWWAFMGDSDRVPDTLLRQELRAKGCHALHWASVTGHLPTLRRILDVAPQAALSSRCLDTYTPLQAAIRFNQPDVVAELLNRWQTVTTADVRLAVKYGSATLARTLYDSLEQEPEALEFHPREGSAVLEGYQPEDLNYLITKRVISPYWLALQVAGRGNELVELAPLVIGQGFPIVRLMSFGLRKGNEPLVEWVLSRSPPLPQRNQYDSSPFIAAAEVGDTELAKRLWQPDAVFGEDNYYLQLEYFAAAGWTEKVLSFAHKRPDLLSYALREAADYRNLEAIRELINAGARAGSRHCPGVLSAAVDGTEDKAVALLSQLADAHKDNRECLTETLIYAVKQGRSEMLPALLDNGADPNGEGDGFNNTVVRAVSEDRLVILVDLLKAGADFSVIEDQEDDLLMLARGALKGSVTKSEPEPTPEQRDVPSLIQAVQAGDLEKIDVLLAGEADVTSTNDRGETAAHIALRSGQFEAASQVLSYDVLLTKDDRGRTPFHLIGAYGSPELARQAMELSRGVYPQDDNDRYPLDYAARLNEPVALLFAEDVAGHRDSLPKLAASYGQQKLMDYLSQIYHSLGAVDYQGKPEAGFFLVALDRGDREWWQTLLDNSLQPEDAFLGEPLLYMAARCGNLPALRALVEQGSTLSTELFRIEPSAPYRHALREGDAALAERLLDTLGWGERGEFLVDVLEPLGEVLSEQALVDWLADAGEDVLDENLAGILNRLIHQGEQLNLLDALVRAGADLYDEDYSDESPVTLTKDALQEKDIGWKHRLSLVGLLAQTHEGDPTPFWQYLQHGTDTLAGVDPEELNKRDSLSGLTLLDAAVFRGDIEAVTYLTRHGADITNSTMHVMAQTGRVQVLEALAPAIYDLNTQDFLGNTPLMTAIVADQRDMVRALLALGARTNVYNLDHRYPLKMAVFNRAEPVVSALLEHGAHPDGFSEQMSSNALTSAVIRDDLKTIKTLIKAGASENPLLGPPPYSVMPYAYRYAGPNTLNYLESVYTRTPGEQEKGLDLAWRFNNEPVVKQLLGRGVSL